VGIAVHGATDAAKHAADLILTEPGLSPIYGAVLESRRIFARIKSYVVYRVAASLILALTLSIIIFASGCAVDSLLVIILALLNDISMIPVAYDHAQATTKPQLPNASKLVQQSVFYGVFHTGAALLFFFTLDHANALELDLNPTCESSTKGFVWFYLVLVTELAIFSVRAPGYFWQFLPAPLLFLSVLVTCVGSALIAIFVSDLSLTNMGYIILYNVVVFVVVDLLKVEFRKLIGESPGEIIETDDLIQPKKDQTETAKFMDKQMRYHVHRESTMNPADLQHVVQIEDQREKYINFFLGVDNSTFMDGYIAQSHRRLSSSAIMPSSTTKRTKMLSSPPALR
jgi:H+-transporting ATPase